jgi:aryl-alcohol dehydrogenase-like predicted oxidoreductase
VRYFDTAPGYGLAEELVLDWLQTKNDPTIEIATKWGYTYTANFDKNAIIHEVKEHSLAKLNAQWEFSKQLLPYLKVYQIHSATIATGVLENQAVLEQLSSLKKEHHLTIGLTTTGENQVEVLKRALDVHIEGTQVFDLFQVTYNCLEQSLQKISQELIQQEKTIVIKEALANGRIFKNKNYQQYSLLYKTLANLAQKYEVGIDAISLKYCAQKIPKSTILSGASTIRQLQENLKADTFMLSSQDLKLLDAFKTPAHYYWSERKKLTWN